jgi:hypothetical protein
MLEPEYIIGLTMTGVEIIKKKCNLDAVYIPLLVFGIAILLNIGNAALFGEDILVAIKEGAKFALTSAGVYGLGKALIEKK